MNKKILAMVSLLCAFAVNAAVELPAKWADYQKLEGADNKGAATLS